MRHKLLTPLLALLVLMLVLVLAAVDPVYGIEEAVEGGPHLWKCFLNFAAFFLLPGSFLALVMVLEFRRRRPPTPPTE